ncbi:MAG: S8 family serine peptidase [Nanobdellota archaeon]
MERLFVSVGLTTVLILLATFIVVPQYPLTGMATYDPTVTLHAGDYEVAFSVLQEHNLSSEHEQVIAQLELRDNLNTHDLRILKHLVEDLDPAVVEDIKDALGYVGDRRSYLVEFQQRKVGVMSVDSLHTTFREDLQNLRGTTFSSASVSSPSRTQSFRRVFNGMRVQLSDEEYSQVNSFPYVKKVHTDKRVDALVWDSKKSIGALPQQMPGMYNGSGITIAVIDTGVNYSHDAFGNCTQEDFFKEQCDKFGPGYDYVNLDADPMDDHGHGTGCASIAAGLEGIAPGATIIPFKALDSMGSGSMSDVIAAIERAVDPNLDFDLSDHYDVISMSLGTEGKPDDPVSQAVDKAVEAGVTVVVAAGNSGEWRTIASPGCAKGSITVGASCRDDQLGHETNCYSQIAGFSSKGPSYGSLKPDVVAPGVAICAASITDEEDSCGEGYAEGSGTSLAAPMVAGAAALLLEARPSWEPVDVKSALRVTAIDLGVSPASQGMGLINVSEALSLTVPPHAYIDRLTNIEYK